MSAFIDNTDGGVYNVGGLTTVRWSDRLYAMMKGKTMVRMSEEHLYKTSKDYKRLYELLRETVVVCIVDYLSCRDIASTLYVAEGSNIGARGINYITAFDETDFINQCDRYNVEFIEPAQSA